MSKIKYTALKLQYKTIQKSKSDIEQFLNLKLFF